MELVRLLDGEGEGTRDPFAAERRFEGRYPATAATIAPFMQGYDRSRESAGAILSFLERRFVVNPAMPSAIRALCAPAREGS